MSQGKAGCLILSEEKEDNKIMIKCDGSKEHWDGLGKLYINGPLDTFYSLIFDISR